MLLGDDFLICLWFNMISFLKGLDFLGSLWGKSEFWLCYGHGKQWAILLFYHILICGHSNQSTMFRK